VSAYTEVGEEDAEEDRYEGSRRRETSAAFACRRWDMLRFGWAVVAKWLSIVHRCFTITGQSSRGWKGGDDQ
jgi:hypothetical protein